VQAEPHVAATAKSGPLGAIDVFQQRNRVLGFVVGVFKKFSDDRGGRSAALMAYYGFFSVFPAMLALVTVLGLVAPSFTMDTLLDYGPGLSVPIAYTLVHATTAAAGLYAGFVADD
jgi:uncharacterized BrkB/YihY/UPF0761 family membrane protein